MNTRVDPAVPAPIQLNFDVLPEKYRNNWYVMLDIESHFAVKFCTYYASEICKHSTQPGDDEAWIAAFDRANLEWVRVNPRTAWWPYNGNWPEGASVFLGNKASEEAISIMRKAHSGAI